MKETKEFLKNISLETILGWISKENNPRVKSAFKILKAQKMLMSNSKMDEMLKVIKDTKLDFIGYKSYNKSINSLLETESQEMTRAYAEYDSDYRQLVCNVILEAESKGNKIYGFLKRGNSYTEKSLRSSIGMIGGHVNATDHNLYSGLIREVSEEIKNISFENTDIIPLGYIRETANNIGRQHLCVLYCLKLRHGANINLHSAEENERFVWMSIPQIEKEIEKGDLGQLDSWARISLTEYLSNNQSMTDVQVDGDLALLG